MKPILLFLTFLVPLAAQSQAWQSFEPFGDTLGVYSISLQGDQTAWIVGCRTDGHDLAMFARTNDGGATFNSGNLPLQQPAYTPCITSSDASTAYVQALQNWGNAVTLKTVDGGQTWEDTHTPWDAAASWPDYIYAFTPAKICQIGDPRNGEFEVYNSLNGGISWVPVSPNNIPDPLPGEFGFNNGGSAVGNHIWFVTNRGRVYHSANSGYNWEAIQTPLDALGIVSFSDSNNGIVSYYGNPNGSDFLYRTTNGGSTWENVTLPISETYHFYGIPAYLQGSSSIVAAIYTDPEFFAKNQTWLSKDRGSTWTQISDGEIAGWPTFNSPTNGWAGEWGPIIPTDHSTRVFKYIGSPIVGLLSPTPLTAEVSISPNPATDFIQIELKNEEPSTYWCLLNDAQGRLVRKIAIEKTNRFSQKMDLTDLPNGIYTLTIANENSSISRQIAKNR